MQFAHPIFLAAGAVACALLWTWMRRAGTKRREALAAFASSHLLVRLTENVSRRRRRLKTGLRLAGVALLFVALARPQVGYKWKEVSRQGIDILFAVDCSKSMLATDVTPNRLERATLGIRDFVGRLDGDRVGLIPFAGSAFLMCPPTLDYAGFEESLDALGPSLLPRGGTDLGSAVDQADTTFSNTANHKFLILITDGEDLEGHALDAAREAAGKDVVLYTLGVGTPEGELVPVNAGQDGGFVKDEQGQVIKSRLDEETLRQMAELTGGIYRPLGARAEGLDEVYAKKLSLVPKEEFQQRLAKVPVERFGWPLSLAILVFLADFLINDRRSERSMRTPEVASEGRRAVRGRVPRAAAVFLLTIPLASHPSEAAASTRSARKAYEQQRYQDAAEAYRESAEKQPDDPRLHFNTGAAAYKQEDYGDAESAFREVLGSDQLDLQQMAYYNLGNTQYRQGQAQESDAPEQALQCWQQAVASYEGALKLNPQDEDAAFNRDLVKHKLQQLMQQQEQQKQQQKQQQSGQQQDQPQPQPSGQGEQQESKPAAPEDQDKPQAASAQPDEKGEPEPVNPQQQQAGSVPNVRRRPGEMTPEEAEQLLDSLKGEEAQVSFLPAGPNASGRDDKVRRDW